MVRIRRRLEFTLLLAAQSEFRADPLDAIDARLDAVISQVRLQAFRPVGFPRPLVCGLNFAFQPEILLLAPRGQALAPDRRFAAVSTDSPSNSTSFTASARNSSL